MNSRGRPAPLPLPRSGRAADHIFSVSEITRGIRSALEDAFGPITVQGEVAGYKGTFSSGHTYFSLKDAGAQIDVVLYADRATPAMLASLQNGLAFQVYGELTVYEKSGRYQIRALRVEPMGYGALQARFDALRKKLELEGLFATDRKRRLPLYPTRIGIVTSESGAALHDMLRILQARAPYARIVFADTRVQGDGAARDIARAIARMNARGGVDVLIVGRGGGSLQDLWAFNEEAVVRAIVASAVPVVSAVGHETDTTLADFAADERAATPTHAAQIVVKEIGAIREKLADMSEHARRRILGELAHARSRLQGLGSHRALREPAWRIREGYQELDRLQGRITRALRDWVTVRRAAVSRWDARLQSHSPGRSFARARDRIEGCRQRATKSLAMNLARRRESVRSQTRLLASFDHHQVLERGYALIWSGDQGTLLKRGAGLHSSDPIQVQFFDARASARVTEVVPERAEPAEAGKEPS
ncbi:MAG TPA: exodeoxyribonuclease VII large subunit [Candidatus Binatia bacterium]|nr:exodeoxyribonuclease VII large subunit [Candidatus Binatia bacterium]